MRLASQSASALKLGSSRKSLEYSFIADPQPAALTTTKSTSAALKTSTVFLARRSASDLRPTCSESAPQQPWALGITTSKPSAASTRAVAAFISEKNTLWTHPVSSPTTPRRLPAAGTRGGRRSIGEIGGATDSIALKSAGPEPRLSAVAAAPASRRLAPRPESGGPLEVDVGMGRGRRWLNGTGARGASVLHFARPGHAWPQLSRRTGLLRGTQSRRPCTTDSGQNA